MCVHLQQPSSLRVKPCAFPVVRLAHGAPRTPALGLPLVTVSAVSRKVLGQEVGQSRAWPFSCTSQAVESSFAGAHVTSTTERVPETAGVPFPTVLEARGLKPGCWWVGSL